MSYAARYSLAICRALPAGIYIADLPWPGKTNTDLLDELVNDFKKFFSRELNEAMHAPYLTTEAENRLQKHLTKLLKTKKLLDEERRLTNR